MKRFAKILLAAVLVVLLALGALAIYLRVKYPSARLKAILISRLANEYGVHVAIERLAFNLFSGFEIEKVKIVEVRGQAPDIPAAYRSPVQIEKATFSYRWRSLFARRLDIDEITILRPSLFYWQAPDNSSNFDALLAAFADSAAVPKDTASAGLPLAINLTTLRIQGLACFVAMASVVDTQHIEFGPTDLEVNEIAVDRLQNYHGRFKITSDPATVVYKIVPVDSSAAIEFSGKLHSNFAGEVVGDAITLQAELALRESQIRWNAASVIPLPSLHTTGKVEYHLASSHLTMPEVHLSLAGREILVAGFEMKDRQGATDFNVQLTRGVLDLAEITKLLRLWQKVDALAAWQTVQASGMLDFSGSVLHKDENGLSYRVALHGEGLNYLDAASGLELKETHAQIYWTDSSTRDFDSLACKLAFTGFTLPLDTLLQTGPGELELNCTLAENFLPRQGRFEFRWQNFSQGILSGKGTLEPVGVAKTNGATLDEFNAAVTINLDSLELAPFTADSLLGRINGKIELHGSQLSSLALDCKIENDSLTYLLEDDHGTIPPYQLSASSKLVIDTSRAQILISGDSLRSELVNASFHAKYDFNAGDFDFNLPDFNLDLSRIVEILPHSFFEEQTPPKMNGRATGEGWLRVRFSSADSLDYYGELSLHSERVSYYDTTYDSYVDSLEIDNRWILTPGKMIGKYSAKCPSPRLMPSYLRSALPRMTTDGMIEVTDDGFVVKDARFDVPAWQISGNYKIDGKFHSEETRIGIFLPILMQLGKSSLPKGTQVETTVDLRLRADAPVSFGGGLTAQGRLLANVVLDQYLPEAKDEPQPAHLRLGLQTENFSIIADTLFALHGMNANLDFAQAFDFLDLTLPEEETPLLAANAGEALLLYDVLGDPRSARAQPNSRLTIARLEVGSLRISDLSAELALGLGRCDVPQFRMNLLGGNLVGSLLVGLGGGNPDRLTYSMSMQASSLDVSRLRRLGAEVEKGSQFSADFYLQGAGASTENLDEIINNLAGRLSITKIEKKAAGNLLAALDPNGTDAGIQRMRFLLKTGWNVKSMTFEVKNGFIYASLAPIKTKPWSALFNLPPTMDFARLPVRYFIETPDD